MVGIEPSSGKWIFVYSIDFVTECGLVLLQRIMYKVTYTNHSREGFLPSFLKITSVVESSEKQNKSIERTLVSF